MRISRSRNAIVLAGVVLVAGTIGVGIALATHGATRVAAEIVTTHTVAQDGFDSGWHTHPGPVIVQVQEGYFKFYQGSCQPTVVQNGETYIEIPDVPVRAVSKDAIKWTTTLILPTGHATRTDVASPCG